MVCVCVCSVGLIHDQLPHGHCNDRPAGQGQDLHVQEVDPLPQLDRSANQRSEVKHSGYSDKAHHDNISQQKLFITKSLICLWVYRKSLFFRFMFTCSIFYLLLLVACIMNILLKKSQCNHYTLFENMIYLCFITSLLVCHCIPGYHAVRKCYITAHHRN